MINNNSKKPDDRLRDNCSSLIALIESTDDMIWSVDREYRLIEANSVFLEYTESFFNKKIEAGSTILDKNMPEYLYERWKEIYDTVFEGNVLKREIESDVIADQKKFLECHFHPIRNENGEITSCSAFCRDITEHLEAEKKLTESSEKYRILAENTTEGLAIFENDVLIFASPSYLNLLGIEQSELYSTTLEDNLNKVHPDDFERVKTSIYDAKENKVKAHSYDLRFLKKDDGFIWIRNFVKREYDEKGNNIRSFVRVEDITELMQTNDKLKDELFFSKKLIDNTPGIIYIYDKIAQKNVYSNDGISKVLGYTPEEIKAMGKNVIKDLMHPDDFVEYQKNILPRYDLLEENEVLEQEYRMKCKDGDWYWLFAKESIYSRDDKGRPKEIFGLVTNITKRKNAELEKIETDKNLSLVLENLSFSVFAHDLDGNFVFVNDAAAECSGYTKSELLELKVDDIDPYSKTRNDREKIWYKLEQGESIQIISEHKRKDGSTYPVEIDLTSARIEGKRILLPVVQDISERVEAEKIVKDHTEEMEKQFEKSERQRKANLVVLNDLNKLTKALKLEIEERKKTERALRESETFLSTLLESIPIPVFYKDIEGKYIGINQAYEKFFGIKQDEILGKSVFDISPTEYAEIYYEKDKTLLENGGNQKFESDVVTAKDEIRHVVFNKAVYLNNAGNISGLIGTILDVTEERNSRNKLEESENKYRSLFENQIESYAYHEMIFDEKDQPVDYRFIDVNKKFLEQTGLKSKKEIVGKSALEIWPDVDKYWIDIYGKVAKTGEFRTFEDYSTPLDKHFLINVYSPKPGFFATSFMDITEKVKAEKAQREADQKLRNIMLNSTNMFYQHGIDQKLTFVSPQVEDILGYTVKEALVKWTDLVSDNPINNEGYKKTVEAIETGKAQAPYQLEMTHKNGDNIYVEVREVPVKEDGKVTSIVGSLVDITEKKKAERDLKESESRYKNLFDYSPVSLWEEDYSKVHKELLKLKENGVTDLSKYINDNPEFIENCIYLADILDISRSAVKLYGANSKKDLMKNLLENAYHIRPIRMFKTALLNIFDSHLKFRGEDTINTLDGKSLIVSIIWEVAPGHEHDYSKVYVSEINITERVKYEEELRASEERFKLFMKYLPGGVFIKDSEFKYTFMNEFNENLLGMTNWRGKTVYDCFDKDLAETFAKDDLKVFEKGFVRKEATVKSVDGKTMYFLNTQFLIPGADKPTLGGISIDITEKKKAEDAILELNRSLILAQEIAKLGYWSFDVETQIPIWSDEIFNMYGIPKELGEPSYTEQKKYVHPDDWEHFDYAVMNYINNDIPYDIQYRVVQKNGNIVWLRSTGLCKKDDNNNIAELYGIALDITSIKKQEEEIKINLAKYKTLFDSLPAGITVSNNKGEIVETNREAENLLGLGEAEQKRRTISGNDWKIIRIDGTAMPTEEFASARALKENKKISNVEMGIAKGKNNITWINVTATPIPLEDYGVVITYFDISDRVAAAKALKESEEKFRSIFYNAQIGIFRTDAKDGKLLMANQKTAEIFGYKTTAAARRYYKLSEHYIDPDAREKLVEQVRKEGRIDNYEAALTNRFNEPRWLKYSVHYKKEGDYFEGVVEDITEKKLLQNKYETIVHNFPNGAIFLFDKEMRYSFTGGNALAREGIKSESLIGYKPNEVWPEDLAKIVMSNNRQILNGNLVNYETKFNDKIFTNWGVPIYEGDNIVNGLVYSVDITELKERNEFIQTVLDNLPIGVALNNIDEGNSFYQNKKFEEIYGWPSKELENIPDFFRKVYPDKEYREKLIERVRTDIETGDQSKMFWENCIITHKDGSKHIVDAQNIPLFKQNTMVSTVRDVTAQKEAENKLRESEALLQAALDNSQAGIAIAEVPDGKLRYVNRAGLMIRGKDEEELVKNIDIDKYVASWKILYLDGREYEPENVPLARAVLNGETVREEFIIRRDNEEDRFVLAHAAPINNELGERIAAIVIFLDITEKKIIEYQLKESEARTRAIFENSLTGIVLAEKDGTILEANPALIKMLGSPSLEASKAINIINFEPLKKIGFSGKFLEAVDKNRITWGEDYYESKWGKKLVVNYSFIPVRRQSKVQRIIGTVEDVTKLREAETALLESEEKYRILVENQNDLVVKTDADGRFEFVSQSYCELFGKSEKELLGSSFIPLIHEEDKKHTEEELKKLETPPYECEIEQRAKTKFGWRWFSWSDKAVVNENGEIESIIGVGRDITERKLAEFQVIEEKNKAEKYLETAGVLMLALDNNCLVTLINQRGADIIGYSKDYIIGKHWINNFIPKENREEVNAVFKKAMRGEVEISMYFENPVLCRYNKVRILGWRNNLLRDDDENIIGILSSAEDVTESIRLKENLQKSNEELFRLSDHLKDIREREKLALARELHDDLGQALTAVKMDLMLAYHELGDDNESLKSKIESAVNLTTHSIKTTQDITSDLRPSMIDDLGLIPAIEWYAKKFGDRSKIKVEVDLTVKDIDIDENNKINLYRIVQECLTNVARHSKADKVTISMKRKKKNIHLKVKDNGVGLTDKELSNPNSFGIIGLKERTYSLKGDIKFTSKPKKGTQVEIVFPSKQ